MPGPCDYTLEPPATDPQKSGQQFTLQINPPPQPGCLVGPASATGGFKVIGVGGGGTVTVEATEDSPKGTISVTIRCEDCGPTTLQVALPQDEVSKLKLDLIRQKRELTAYLEKAIKEAEAVVQADQTLKKNGLLAPHSSQEANDIERVARLKKEKLEVGELLVKELQE
jgi:hypothetical protein